VERKYFNNVRISQYSTISNWTKVVHSLGLKVVETTIHPHLASKPRILGTLFPQITNIFARFTDILHSTHIVCVEMAVKFPVIQVSKSLP
jgi:hypothetical protein